MRLYGLRLIGAGLAVLAPLALRPPLAACADAPTKSLPKVFKTRVVMYEPAVPRGPARKGSCWTGSIAVTRPGAWRCMAGNVIHDPCFAVASRPGIVVCGAEPATGKKGFPMKLTKPLPKPDLPAGVKPRPWIMQLANGTLCEAHTGTMAIIGGQPVPWGCNDSRINSKSGERRYFSGVLGKPKMGKVWMVEKVVFIPTPDSKHPFKLIKREMVAVRAVWD